MIKSHYISLVATVSLLALTACSDQSSKPQNQATVQKTAEAPLYSSVNECVEAGNDKDLCSQAIAAASANTPRYAGASAKAQCEAEYGPGNCESRSDSSGDWVGPALMGFMVGNMLSSNNGYQSNGYYRGGDYDRDYNDYRRNANRPTTSYTSPVNAPARQVAPTKTVVRNGFSTATPPSSAARPTAVKTTTTVGSAPITTAKRTGSGFGSAPASSSFGNTKTRPAPAYTAPARQTSSFGSSSSSRSSSYSSSSSSSRSTGGFGGSRSSSGSR